MQRSPRMNASLATRFRWQGAPRRPRCFSTCWAPRLAGPRRVGLQVADDHRTSARRRDGREPPLKESVQVPPCPAVEHQRPLAVPRGRELLEGLTFSIFLFSSIQPNPNLEGMKWDC